jgi:delta1-piperideine-2-carboxylate reductase
MPEHRLTLDECHALAMTILTRHGVSEAQARAVADTVTAAERDNCKSHGLFRIPGYLASSLSGKVDGQAIPVVTDLAPGAVKVDAKRGYAPLALAQGLPVLAEKARTNGIAALAITQCHHFAALWPEVEQLADEGLVGFAFTAAFSYVAPAGGTKPLYGTNPMAFAWPRPGRSPLAFDQASSASARGEIQLHKRDGHDIPDGWAIDVDGNPTTDPTAALAGAQLPFGGYKGAAIALMVELLAGALLGEALSFEATANDNGDGGPPTGGEFLIAIDPNRCGAAGGAAAVMAHAESLFEKVAEQPGTRLPSDRRFEARQLTPTEGITVVSVLFEELQNLKTREVA